MKVAALCVGCGECGDLWDHWRPSRNSHTTRTTARRQSNWLTRRALSGIGVLGGSSPLGLRQSRLAGGLGERGHRRVLDGGHDGGHRRACRGRRLPLRLLPFGLHGGGGEPLVHPAQPPCLSPRFYQPVRSVGRDNQNDTENNKDDHELRTPPPIGICYRTASRLCAIQTCPRAGGPSACRRGGREMSRYVSPALYGRVCG